jgi:hypothetical protein
MTEKLSPNFLNELFRSAFRNKNIFEILQAHLEFHFLPTEEYKQIWKTSKLHYELLNELPTIGLVAEQNKDSIKVLDQLNQIKNADVASSNSLVKQIESYLKDARMLSLYDRFGDLMEQSKKKEALELMKKESESIFNFSLQAQQFTKLFKGFEERYNTRAIANAMKGSDVVKKACWGIDCLDYRHHGGVNYGDTACILALSNVGKSPFLKHIGYSNARNGKNVLHIQVEGTKVECEESYEAMMAASSLVDIETTSLDKDVLESLKIASRKMTTDIDIVAFEQFGSVTMNDVRGAIIEYLKVHKELDVLILDYIDKVEPSNGKKYSTNMEGEKARKQALADSFKNLCMEFNIAGFTATQASNVPELSRNNPKFYLSRDNIAGDKSFVTPFSYFVTLSQTLDEQLNEQMRLFEDKCRKYGSGFKHTIMTGYRYSRFYDRKRTINLTGEK